MKPKGKGRQTDEESAPLINVKDLGEDASDRQWETLPAETNSWQLTGIQLLNSMLGSGILAFPYTLAHVGILMFTLNIVIFTLAVLLTSIMLIEAGKRKGILNFSRLTEAVFGPVVAKALNFCIFLSSMGSMLSYLNVIGALGSQVVSTWSGASNIGISTYGGFIALVSVLEIPLIMFRSYGELTPISVASLFFIVVIVLFVAIQGQIEVGGDFLIAHTWSDSFLSGAKSLGTFAYASSLQTAIFEAYLSTRKEDKPLFVKGSVVLAVVTGASLLVLMAVFGYGAFGQDCDSDILSNFSAKEASAQAAMLVVVLHLALYIPNAFVIMRLFAVQFFGHNVLQLRAVTFVATTVSSGRGKKGGDGPCSPHRQPPPLPSSTS
jgi:sodium-coupled neutral amino acid transporter 11